MRTFRVVPWPLVAAVALASIACSPGSSPPVDDELVRAERDWREHRAERLRVEDGWLALVGLHWLGPGEWTFGGSPSCSIHLEGGRLPDVGGTLIVADDLTVRLQPAESASVTVNGDAAISRPIASDAHGEPDVIGVGRLRMYVIRRGDRIGLRVKDPQAPPRIHFEGLDWFPPASEWRVTARLKRFAEPRTIRLPAVAGGDQKGLVPGKLMFTIDGEPCELLPLVSEPGATDLFIVFRDATSGRSTYGAGRFLSAAIGPDGTVVLNFNRAYNPPCAFTPYATCPLPPPDNELRIAVRAGEKLPRSHH